MYFLFRMMLEMSSGLSTCSDLTDNGIIEYLLKVAVHLHYLLDGSFLRFTHHHTLWNKVKVLYRFEKFNYNVRFNY